MIDRGLESVFVLYNLAMRILLVFLMSSLAQLEAEIQNGPTNLKDNILKKSPKKTNIDRIFLLTYSDLADKNHKLC